MKYFILILFFVVSGGAHANEVETTAGDLWQQCQALAAGQGVRFDEGDPATGKTKEALTFSETNKRIDLCLAYLQKLDELNAGLNNTAIGDGDSTAPTSDEVQALREEVQGLRQDNEELRAETIEMLVEMESILKQPQPIAPPPQADELLVVEESPAVTAGDGVLGIINSGKNKTYVLRLNGRKVRVTADSAIMGKVFTEQDGKPIWGGVELPKIFETTDEDIEF